MAIGAPEPRTGSAYWSSGAAGLGAAAEVARRFTPVQALASLKAPAPPPQEVLEVGKAPEAKATTYDATGRLAEARDPGRVTGAPPRVEEPPARPAEPPKAQAPAQPPPTAAGPRPAAASGKDANGDGLVSPAERLAYLASHPALDPRDLNLDGTVSPAEARAAEGARQAPAGGVDLTA